MTKKEKFQLLVSDKKTDSLKKNRDLIKNRVMIRESQRIALKVLMKLDELGWYQKDLAKKMEVSPQQITKIVKGKENLTLETQIKLQAILDIPILASYYEKDKKKVEEIILSNKTVVYTLPTTQKKYKKEVADEAPIIKLKTDYTTQLLYKQK